MATKKEGVGGMFKDGKSRLLFIIGGSIAAIILFFVFMGGDDPSPPSELNVPPQLDSTAGGEVQEESPRFRELVEQGNQQRIEEAEQSGTSALPTIGTFETRAPQARAPQQNVIEPLIVYTEPQVNSNFNQLMFAQMQQITTHWTNPRPSQSQIILQRVQQDTQNGGAANGQAGGAYPGVPGEMPLVNAGQVLYGQFITATDSRLNGPIVAEIISGPFRGARLIGSFAQEGYTPGLFVVFQRLTLANGMSYQINATAISPQTAETHVASDIDHRLLTRYGLRLAAAFIGTFASSMAETSQNVISNGAGELIQENRDPTEEESIWAGASVASNMIQSDIENIIGDGRPVIRLRSGDGVGILFLESVFPSHVEMSGGQSQEGNNGEGNPANGLMNLNSLTGALPAEMMGAMPTGFPNASSYGFAPGTFGTNFQNMLPTGSPIGLPSGYQSGFPSHYQYGYQGSQMGGYPAMGFIGNRNYAPAQTIYVPAANNQNTTSSGTNTEDNRASGEQNGAP